MRRGNYLNVILTVNAGLIAGLLWTQISGTPLLDRTASAQTRSKLGPPPPTIPNAARQRDAMLQAIRDLAGSVETTNSLLQRGAVKVEVTNLDEITLE